MIDSRVSKEVGVEAMRKRLQQLATVLFLISSVLLGTIYVVAPALRMSHNSTTAAPAQATNGPTPTVNATTPTTQSAAARPLPALSVRGTRLVDANGHMVTLLGASHSSLEYACTGDGHFSVADFADMRAWGMNVVRLPLSSEFWVQSAVTCPQYRQYVTQAVRNAEAAGLYVIVDLQWDAPFNLPADRAHGGAQCPMPDALSDATFWQEVAAQFANDPQVIFDLFGEPHDISWQTWYAGGAITQGCDVIQASGVAVERGTYRAIGMRDLARLIRAVAPQNLLMVAGLNWGYDLAQASAYPLGVSNVLYDTHPFDYAGKQPSDWNRAFGELASRAAVIAGEFGSYNCGTSYIAQAISYFNAHQMSWLAWTWGPNGCGGPSLLSAWPNVPSAPYGSYIERQMLAARRAATG